MKKSKLFTNTAAVWLFASLCCLLWGSAFPAIKIGYNLFEISSDDTFTIILFAGVRFFIAGILTIVIFSFINKKPLLPKRSSLPKIGVLSVFQTILQYVFFYLGLAYTTGERASVIQGTNVFFALLISSLIFRYEKLSVNKILGCVVGFAGVLLVSLDVFTQSGTGSFLGEAMVLLCTISYSFSSVFMKKYSAGENPAMLSGWQFVLGGFVMIAVGIIGGGRLNRSGFGAIILLIYLAMVSAVAYSLWSILLKYNPVSKVAVCGFLTPVFGFVLSAAFSGGSAKTGLISLVALLFVVAGIVLVNYHKES